jgi:hypothetical protein
MSPRTPILLAVLCAVLAGALWGLESLRPSPEAQARKALVPLAAREVERIHLAWPTESADLERRGETWWFSGRNLRADERAIRAALAELELLSRAGLVAGAVPGRGHGLSPPRLALRVSGPRGEANLAFGDRVQGNRIYLGLGGELFLVAERAADFWGRSAEGLRDTRLLHFDPETVTSVRVGDDRVTRRGRRWVLSRPSGARADPEGMRTLTGALASLHGARGDGVPLSLEVTDGSGTHAGEGQPPPEAAQRLKEIVARLPARYPVQVLAADIDRVEIHEGKRVLRLTRAEDEWKLPGGLSAEASRMRELLGSLLRLQAREVLGPEAAARVEPVSRTFVFEAAGERTALEIGPARQGTRAARFAGESAIYLFADGPWANASADLQEWRRRVVWDLPPASIEALALGDAEVRRNESFRWVRVRPVGAPLDPRRVEKLARALASPRVERFLAGSAGEARAGSFLPLRVETIDGDRRTWHTLEVSARAVGKGRLARTPGQLFVLDESLYREAVAVIGARASD